jgi:DNA-binding MarR family transcriptional regulator
MSVRAGGSQFHKQFENRARLLLMSVLAVNDALEFTSLRELLRLTDGNLSAHMSVLERAGYVRARKRFLARKPKTTYESTKKGREAFVEHLNALEELIGQMRHR